MSLRFEHGFLTLALIAQAASALADDRFSVRHYEISGAQVDAEVTRPFTGENISIEDIQRASRAVEQRLGKGWKVIIVPDQDVTDGTVRFQAILAGHPPIVSIQDPAKIADYFTGLQAGMPFDATRARAQATLYRDMTGDFARVDVHPEAIGVGLTLQADQSIQKTPLRFSAGIDNTGSTETGWNRLTLTAGHINLWGERHVGSIAAVLSTAQPQDVRVLIGSYRVPLFNQDAALDFYAANSRSAISNVNELAIRGNGTILGTRYSRFVAFDSIAGTHQFSVGIEQRKLDSVVSFNDVVLEITPDYAMRPLTLAYSYTQAGRFTSSVSFSRGLGGSDADNETYEQVRYGAKANYNILRGSAEALWPLFGGLTGRLAVSGQYTNNALVPGEQFGLGGTSTIRGFQEREINNDKGYRISAELSKQIEGEHRLISFLDHGRTSRNAEQPGDPGTQNVLSVGIGARVGVRSKWAGGLDFAHVVRGSQITPKGNYRIHFHLAVFF